MIEAKTWRKMTTDEIITSIEIAIRVLKERKDLTSNNICSIMGFIEDLAKIATSNLG